MTKLNVVEITVKLADGNVLTFPVKYNPVVKIIRGVHQALNEQTGVVEMMPNGKEAMIIVAAPDGVKKFFDDKGDIHYWIQEELNKNNNGKIFFN